MTDQQPKITVYWLDHSRSQRIVWLLEELNLPYEIQVFHRNKQTLLAPPELEKIHPLGKAPVISITPLSDGQKPIVLAESGFMAQYLVDHAPHGKTLMPRKQWREGMDGKMGGETEEWLRYHYYMHYAEGSLIQYLVFALVVSRLKSPQVPFFARPITSIIANRIIALFIYPNVKRHLAFLEDQLTSSSGKYICGESFTAADILMSFPLIAGAGRFDDLGSWEGGTWTKAYPKVAEYVRLLEAEKGYKRSVERIEALEGSFGASL